MHILIPVQLKKAMNELPPTPLFEEFTPIPPPPSPEPVSLIRGAIAIILLMAGVGFVSNFINRIFGLILLLVGLGIIIWQMQVQYITYKSRLDDHTTLTENYFLLLESYSRKQGEHEQKIAISRTGDRLKEFRSSKILEILSQTKSQIAQKALIRDKLINFEDNSEFAKSLKASLNEGKMNMTENRLHQGITIQIPAFDYTFIPDFTYIDPTTNLHIAITIAVRSDKTSKEYQEICNTFLLKSGWIICNFNSDEILDYPDRCIKTIGNLIDDLL